MSLHKLTAGDGYTYLTRQVAAQDATDRGHTGLAEYYDERGESPGRWLGAGLDGLGIEPGEAVSEAQMVPLFGTGRHPNAAALEAAVVAAGGNAAHAVSAGALGRPFNLYPAEASGFQAEVAREFRQFNLARGERPNAAIPAGERAMIRTAVATRLFTEEQGRGPVDARELSGFIARASRPATSAVAGYDLTFSPVKSVSTLWALASPEVASAIERAHRAAVADTVGWLEREAAFTRVGAGARQVQVRGLVAAAFTHRDSRAGDPDLHTHVAVANKVQSLDGRWLALDGRVLFKANVAASERYNTRLEAELVDRLGVRFVDRETRPGKRPVREVAGVSPMLADWWSTRRRAIETRRTVLAEQFQAAHGRTPTPVEAIALAQQATLETRDPKHQPRSETAQRAAWRRDAREVLGGRFEVDAMITRALHPRPVPARPARLTGEWVAATAEQVVRALEGSRATWQPWHVRAEAERQARAANIPISDVDAAVDAVVTHTLEQVSVRLGEPDPITEPAALRRADGESVYEVHGSTRYTSIRVLDAEQSLLATARTGGGRAVDRVRVGIAVAEAAANGTVLSESQAAMVTALATSGARLQLALAPAGTGKTTTMTVLARAWSDSDGYVLGLAPSAQAARELGNAIGGHTDTLAKLTWTLTHVPKPDWPTWVQRVGPRTLVIIDEAGQAGTTDLALAVDFITSRGGSVRLVGDDQQLASVAAGGILRDLTHTVGAVTLTDVHRFTNPAEAAATLAIRDGDPTAVGFYADHHRIHVGDLSVAADQAYTAWATDRAAGLDSILLAPTHDLVTRLNTRARTDRLHRLTSHLTTGATPTVNGQVNGGGEVGLVDCTRASAGDLIITRRNNRRLTVCGGDWVKNGDRWTVQQVHVDGSLRARRLGTRVSVVLPADYVAEHVQLGYASTVHTAQGVTVDTAHAVVTGDEDRQVLYVAVTRGRTGNHLYLANSTDGDPHTLNRPDTVNPPTAVEVLARILARDGSQQSATSTRRHLDAPATLLNDAVVRYTDALGYAAQQVLGPAALTALDREVDVLWPGLAGEPAWSTLRGQLALHTLNGADPVLLLADATADGWLGTAHDRAAVLAWRIGSSRTQHGPLPSLPAIPSELHNDPEWGAYLQAREARIKTLADQVRADAERGQANLDRATAPAPRRETGELHPWEEQLPDQVNIDPAAPRLIERLHTLNRTRADVTAALASALNQPDPLPDDVPADALWWRVLAHLGPLAVESPDDSTRTRAKGFAQVETGSAPPARWRSVLEELRPGITEDPGYPALERTLRQVHAEGFDVSSELESLVQIGPLWATSAAVDLRYRVIAASQLTPVSDVPPAIAASPSSVAPSTTEHLMYGLGHVPGGPPSRGPGPPRR